MKGIDKITARIEAEAIAEAAHLEEEGKARCQAIAAEAEVKAQERYWQCIQAGAKAAEERRQRLGKTADMEARKSILSYKQAIVAEAFGKAEQKLRSLSGEEYVDFLASMAARAAVTGTEEILLSGKDRPMGAEVAARANTLLSAGGKTAKLSLSAQMGDFDGGLILRQGNISVNCTVEALMHQAREDMAAEVAAALFS